MKKILILFICFLCGYVSKVWAQAEELERLLASSELKHAVAGISVKAVKDGQTIVEYASDRSLQPASVCKLLSSAFALKVKGKDFHYTTSVTTTGKIEKGILEGDIVIRVEGDPCLDSRFFPDYMFLDSLVETIGQKHIRKIQGEVRIEGNKNIILPGSWLWEDISNYYGAAYFPFNYKDNTYYLGFRTGKAGEKARLLFVEPEQPGLRFVSEVVAEQGNTDNAWIYGGPYSREMHILGTLPQNRELYRIKGAMHRPDLCFLSELERKLRQNRIVIENERLPGGEEKELITFTSPALKEIVRETNKKSINLFAEALGGLVADGNYPARCCQLLQEIGIDSSGVILRDACGLSAINAVPARVFTDLLVWAYRELGWDFVASLPLAGTDAGLNTYLSAAPVLKSKLRAKTGSFTGVRCLSGYLTTKKGEVLAFTILINHFNCPPARLQKRIGEYLATLL